MEAIRLSLASEEERQRREEKEARKDAKKREKEREQEAKKADRAARKTGLYSNNTSSTALDIPPESSLSAKATSATTPIIEESSTPGKGKGVDRESTSNPQADFVENPASTDQTASATDPPLLAEPSRPSHLRHVSSASSSFTSIMDTTPEDRTSGPASADEGTPSLEPMFNFRSLAAVIDDDEKDHAPEHVEDTIQPQSHDEGPSSATPSVHQPTADANKSETAPVVSAPTDVCTQKELETRSVEITTPAADSETI